MPRRNEKTRQRGRKGNRRSTYPNDSQNFSGKDYKKASVNHAFEALSEQPKFPIAPGYNSQKPMGDLKERDVYAEPPKKYSDDVIKWLGSHNLPVPESHTAKGGKQYRPELQKWIDFLNFNPSLSGNYTGCAGNVYKRKEQ